MHTFKSNNNISPLPRYKNIQHRLKAKNWYFPFNTVGWRETSQMSCALDSSQFSRRTVRSSSSSLMLIVAMAPSLNSNEVPPSTTMQASQHRERTHTLKQQRHHNIQKIHFYSFSSVNSHLAWVLRLRNAHWLAGEASLPTAGEDSVDDGLPDAVEQTPVVWTEHQRLVVLISNWTHRDSTVT